VTCSFKAPPLFCRGDFKAAHAFYQDARNAAVHTADPQLDLVTKLNLARIAVEEGHPQTAIGTLQSVRDSANAAGIKYLALQCSISFSKALIFSKKYPQAQSELQCALVAGEKLGTAELVAESHDLLARIADPTGNASESQHQHQRSPPSMASRRNPTWTSAAVPTSPKSSPLNASPHLTAIYFCRLTRAKNPGLPEPANSSNLNHLARAI
jgi:ATP/maltotriose-dependent transcriptional regulator MalT